MEVLNTEVKQESGRDICYGCLSHNRILKPMKDHSGIFAHIFGIHYSMQDQKSVPLCWECSGIVQKIHRFQYQAQCAQSLLRETFYNTELSTLSLSTISVTTLDNITIDGTNQSLRDEIQITILPVKNKEINSNAPELSDSFTDAPIVTKSENLKYVLEDNDDFNNDVLSDDFLTERKDEFNTDIKEKKVKKKTVKKKCKVKIEPVDVEIDNVETVKKAKKGPLLGVKKFKSRAKITKNPNVDLKNYEVNFIESTLNEAELLKIGIKMRRQPHKSNKKPVCIECMKMFAHCQDYKRHKTFCHILKTESKGPYHCLECETKCENKESLRKHWEKHNITLICKLCRARVVNQFEFKLHSEMHKYLLTCKECNLPGFNVTFNNNKDFGYHFKTLHRRVVCDYCGRESYTPKALAKHIKKEHMPKHCKECDKWFEKYVSFQRHNISLHPERADREESQESRYCVECDKHFASFERYRRHLKATTAHNPEAVKYWRNKWIPCPQCGKVFKRNSVMKAHYKLFHEKKTDHYCELCDKYLVSAYRLRKHVEGVHLKIRDPKNKFCEMCGRGFGSNAVLKKHIRTHTGERPYRCTYCPAAFTQSTPLKSHLKSQHNSV